MQVDDIKEKAYNLAVIRVMKVEDLFSSTLFWLQQDFQKVMIHKTKKLCKKFVAQLIKEYYYLIKCFDIYRAMNNDSLHGVGNFTPKEIDVISNFLIFAHDIVVNKPIHIV